MCLRRPFLNFLDWVASGCQLGVILPSTRCLVMFRDVFKLPAWGWKSTGMGAAGNWSARGAAEHPVIHTRYISLIGPPWRSTTDGVP